MYYIGIDLGGTNIAAGVVDETFHIVKKGSVPTGAHRTADDIVADMGKLVLDLLKETGLEISDLAHIGIASPGTVDHDHGVVVYANNLPFSDYPIADKLREIVPVKKILTENDANAAAKGEAVAGCAKGYRSSVMITLGTGVGGGIIIDGKVYSGFNYAGAELGHMVIEKDGVPCSCGRTGCWESYSSATALIRMTKEQMRQCPDSAMWAACDGDIDRVSGKTAFAVARTGDAAAQAVVDRYNSYLACGLSNIINIFQPEVLSIGGGVSNESEENLLNPVKRLIAAERYTKQRGRQTIICTATLKNDAGIVGAAALGL